MDPLMSWWFREYSCILLEMSGVQYDDAVWFLDVVEPIPGVNRWGWWNKEKDYQNVEAVIVEDLQQQIYASKEEHTNLSYNVLAAGFDCFGIICKDKA